MPGLGWRKFAAGEVLTATNLQSYAVDQSVQRYAGSAARGSAIGTAVTEGMVSYLDDLNQIEVYDSAAWIALANKSNVTSLEGTRPGTSGKPLNVSAGSLTTSASAQTTVTFPAGRFTVTPIITAAVLDNASVIVPYLTASGSASVAIGAYTLGGARVAAVVHWQATQMISGPAAG